MDTGTQVMHFPRARARGQSTSYEVVFFDLDNTLYDWLGFFAPAIRGMLYRLAELSGLPARQLYDDFRTVFTSAGNVEYSFALENLPSLVEKHPELSGREIAELYWPAVRLYQHRRRKNLRLYPGVREGLTTLRSMGVRCIAVTDALAFQAGLRLKKLKVAHLLELAAQDDHPIPELSEIVRKHDSTMYEASLPVRHKLPYGLRKPQSELLKHLMNEIGVSPNRCLYVGDNLIKDISMAKDAYVMDCWASYGCRQVRTDLMTIARVTHWDPAAVVKAEFPSPQKLGIEPSVTARAFDDVVALALGLDRRQRHGDHKYYRHRPLREGLTL